MSVLFRCAIFGATFASALADNFTDLAGGFGVTQTLAGHSQTTTNNPDGTAINFWQPSSEGATAAGTALSNPHNAGADAFGNVYIADKSSHSILRIDAQGLIHTFAGTHVAGFNGDGPAPATSLQLANPNGLYVFPDGTVYLLDPGNHRIRRVTPDGTMTTVVNDPDPAWYPSGRALWVSPDQQTIYYTHEYAPVPPSTIADGATVKMWTPSGGISVLCSRAVGFRNPGNIAVSPLDGKLYVTDRAEDDGTKTATGLFRIDGPDERTRIVGNSSEPAAADGQLALHSFIDNLRGVTFLPDGGAFLCGHKEGSIWHMDPAGVLHRYLRGAAKKDAYSLPDGQHPPLVGQDYFAQPRSVTLAPNGDLLVVCNDSGFVFRVKWAAAPVLPVDLRLNFTANQPRRLEWTGVFSRGYRVQRSADLGAGAWETIGATAGLPDDASFFEDAQSPAPAAAFYRLLPSL